MKNRLNESSDEKPIPNCKEARASTMRQKHTHYTSPPPNSYPFCILCCYYWCCFIPRVNQSFMFFPLAATPSCSKFHHHILHEMKVNSLSKTHIDKFLPQPFSSIHTPSFHLFVSFRSLIELELLMVKLVKMREQVNERRQTENGFSLCRRVSYCRCVFCNDAHCHKK